MSPQSFMFVISGIVCACLLSSGCSTPAKRHKGELHADAATTELFRDIHLLQDMDAGNLESVRQELNNDAMTRLFTIIEGVGFTTNKNVLLEQPGLRGAARYWGEKALPNDIQIFQFSGVSNIIQQAITTIRPEFDRERKERETNK